MFKQEAWEDLNRKYHVSHKLKDVKRPLLELMTIHCLELLSHTVSIAQVVATALWIPGVWAFQAEGAAGQRLWGRNRPLLLRSKETSTAGVDRQRAVCQKEGQTAGLDSQGLGHVRVRASPQ